MYMRYAQGQNEECLLSRIEYVDLALLVSKFYGMHVAYTAIL